MKRQPNGVNFDEGLALQTEQELDLLYVDARRSEIARLIAWFDSDDREGILLGGQIGIGKSTLLNALMVREQRSPDVLLAFDRKTPSFSPGGFWGYVLAEFVEAAIAHGVAIPEGFGPRDFPEVSTSDWPGLCELLKKFPATVDESDRLNVVHSRIAARIDLAERQCRELIAVREQKIQRTFRIVCEGVDKFPLGEADFASLSPVLNLLSEFKTLFEVNVVHLFGRSRAWQRLPSVFIPPFGFQETVDILMKRLGVYEAGRRDILPFIARFSGGNPRQALRLLVAYDYGRGSNRASEEDALGYACRRVRADYLYLSFETIPSDILATVERDRFIRAGIIAGVGLLTPSAQAIYRNWIVLRSEPHEDDRWPADLNPLIQGAKLITDTIPDSPEMAAIKRWADRHGESPYGLDFDKSRTSSVEVLSEIASSTSSMDALNIVELLDTIASSLFVTGRQDRVVIAYQDAETMATARDYLIGKANEMGYFPPVTVDLGAALPDNGAVVLLDALKDEQVIYNIMLPKSPDKGLLSDLDRRRDDFIHFEMLWWVQADDLPACLQQWPQLRQLMSVYRLEDELLGSLSPEDLQGDLDFMGLLEKDDGIQEAEKSLQRVLNVLRKRAGR